MARRLAVLVFGVCGVAGVWGASAALADPVNNPHSNTFEVTCGTNTFTLVAPRGSAGHIVGSTQNLVLQSVSGVDPDFGPFSFSNPGLSQNGSLTTCTTTFLNPNGKPFLATIGVIITPRG